MEKKIEIIQNGKRYSFYPNISALVSLPAGQRGIHLSRTSETLEELTEEVIATPVSSIESFGKKIAERLMKYHPYASKAEITMKGKIMLQTLNERQQQIQKSYKIDTTIYAEKDASDNVSCKYFLGVSAVGMTCCPCVLGMNKEYSARILANRKDIHVSEGDLEKLLEILPISSHSQRSVGSIKVQVKNHGEDNLEIFDLIDVIENSMSEKIQPVLKRPAEAELVRNMHFKPLFSEDVIREMAVNFIKKKEKLSGLDDDFTVNFKIESFESIHPYNVYAELETTIGELKEIVYK